jgi:curved DNA-binding protein
LGVKREATPDEIQKAYRKLARQFHPDVNKGAGAEDKFKQATEAYEVLKDPEKRKRYDLLGQNWKNGEEFQPPPGWEQVFTGGGAGGLGGMQFEGSGFSDFFDALFGGGLGGAFANATQSRGDGKQRARRRGNRKTYGRGGNTVFDWDDADGFSGATRGRARGENIQAVLTIPLEDALRGATRTVNIGIPQVDEAGQTTTVKKQYQVKIPAGITDGSLIRLGGQGVKGSADGTASGDLILRIVLAEDPRFKREGINLVASLPLSPWEAALGTTVHFTTLDGGIALKIPPGTQTGQRLRIRGRGLPIKRSAAAAEKDENAPQRGDLYVELKVNVPPNLTERERELFEELAKVSEFSPR